MDEKRKGNRSSSGHTTCVTEVHQVYTNSVIEVRRVSLLFSELNK